MANNTDSLSWEIEKIVDCKGDDIKDGGWVRINPMSGNGNTNAQVSVTPSLYWNDCKEAVITISAATGDKKYVTINRCNPECNCDALTFTPIPGIEEFSSDGGEKDVATYSMKYCCNGINTISLVNLEGECDYELTEIENEENPCEINGTVKAIVGPNDSTTNGKTFSYYVTYNGIKCGQNIENAFSQERAKDTCELETLCPDVFYEYQGEDTKISWNTTILHFILTDFSICWTLTIGENSGKEYYEISSSGDGFVDLYIPENTDYNNEENYIFNFYFRNELNGENCNYDISITQGVKPFDKKCETCNDFLISDWKVYGTISNRPTKNKEIASFRYDCIPDSGFKIVHAYGDSIIKNHKIIKPNENEKYCLVLADLNDNNDDFKKTEKFYLVGNGDNCKEGTLTQEAYHETIATCDLEFGNIYFDCNERNESILVIQAYKKNGCTINTEIEYQVFNNDGGGQSINPVLIGYKVITSITENDCDNIIDAKSLGIGNYTVNVYNNGNYTNYKSQHVQIIENCNKEQKIIKFSISATNNSYLFQLDNIIVYLKNKNSGDIKCFPLNKNGWSAITSDDNTISVNSSNISVCKEYDGECKEFAHSLNFGASTYSNCTQNYKKIFQNIIVNVKDYPLTDAEISNYWLYLVEKYDVSCGNAKDWTNQLKKLNKCDGIGINWDSDASFLDAFGLNGIKPIKNSSDEYLDRINFKVDLSGASVDDDDDELEIALTIAGNSTNISSPLADENEDEEENDAEIIDNESE